MVAEPIELHIKHRRLRPAMMFLLAAAALLVLLVCGVGIALLISERRVREELAKIRAAGEPVTPADLEAFYSLPPGSRDSTGLWLAAAEAVTQAGYRADAAELPLIGDANHRLPEPGEAWPRQAVAEQFLAKYAPLLAKVYEAAALGGEARYPTRFADDDALIVKPLARLRSITPLLKLESEVHARRGDGHAAAEAIHAIFALAHSLEGEPLLVSLLVRLEKDGVAIDCFQRLSATLDVPDADLAMLDADLAAIDYPAQLHRSMLGARVMVMRTFDDPEKLIRYVPQAAGPFFFRQADRAIFLRLMRDMTAASAATDTISAMRDVREKVRATFASPTASWRYPIAKFSLSSLDVYADAVGRGTARRNVARTAIAIERFRRAKGRLPKALGELVPHFIIQEHDDPFNGAALRWTIRDDDWVVYSVGPNGIDEGGTVKEASFAGDIAFRAPRHKQRGTADE